MNQKLTSAPIQKISIEGLLPLIFSDSEKDVRITNSNIWLKSITLNRGSKTLIQAESGTGKSSLISFLYGRRTDYKGKIYFNDRNIKELSVSEWCTLRRVSLGWLPQEMALFSELTAWQNVTLKNRLTQYRDQAWIEDAFKLLEIHDRINSRVDKMSVGQQQRVAIIRALCQPADFIFLDEPVSHLDERTNKLVADFIDSVLSETGAGLIVTSVGNHLALNYDLKINL